MNCEICSEKFTRLKDLARHATSERHGHTRYNCIPCALTLSPSDVVQHIASKEHLIAALATGVYFNAGHKCSNTSGGSFPPHNCCLLCSDRNGTQNDNHLSSPNHKYMAWLLRTIINSPKIYCNDRRATYTTETFVSKVINVKQKKFFGDTHFHQKFRGSLAFVCELCNLHFNQSEYYKQHLENESHERVEQFLKELYHIMKQKDIVGDGYLAHGSRTFSNSLRPLYYCEACCMWIDTIFNYVQHRKSNKHKRVESMWKRSYKRKMDDIKPIISAAAATSFYSKPESYLKDEDYRDCYGGKSSKISRSSALRGFEAGEMSRNSTPWSSFEDRESARKSTCRPGFEDSKTARKSTGRPGSEDSESSKKSTCRHGSEDSESTKKSTSRPGFGAGESAKKSTCQSGFEDRETARNSQHCFEAGQTARNSPPLLCVQHGGEININSSEPAHEDKEADDVNSDQEHYCELCDFLSYSSVHYRKHLMGEQHKRMRKLINKKEKRACVDARGCEAVRNAFPLHLNCELCDVLNRNSQEYEFHLNSAMHKRNHWLLYVLKQRPL